MSLGGATLANAMRAAGNVPRVVRNASGRIDAYDGPVVVTNGLEGRPASSWTFDLLRSRVGARVVPVEYSLRPVYVPNPKLNGGRYYRKMLRFEALLDHALGPHDASQGHLYASTLPVTEWLPELGADLEPPPDVTHHRFRHPVLFVGGDGTGSHLHYDTTANLVAVLRGAKHVLLLSPDQRRNLYPASLFAPLPHFSRVDPRRPDAARFPRFRDLPAWETTVTPGEAVYIPAGWWHRVTNIGPTIGVSFVFDQPRWRRARWRYLRVTFGAWCSARRWPTGVARFIARRQNA